MHPIALICNEGHIISILSILSIHILNNQCTYLVQLMISTNSAFKEAPPTRKPLISGQA